MAPLVPVGSRLLVAVSGGPDSVALAALLKQLPYQLVIGHVNHGLRSGSVRDARFVRRLATQSEWDFFEKQVPVRSHAAATRMGIEEAARALRYRALTTMARKGRCCAVVTGHNADDQSETVLMNFLRGSGGTGLAGMPMVRTLSPGILLIRPLLGTTRQEIRDYLKTDNRSFRNDPSNQNKQFFRNRIRHETLPSLESLQPGLRERLSRTADIFRAEENFWHAIVSAKIEEAVCFKGRRIVIDLTSLFGYHKALSRRILRRCLPGFTFPDFERILSFGRSAGASARLDFRGGWTITKKADQLVIRIGKTK